MTLGHNGTLSDKDRMILIAYYHRKDRDFDAQARAVSEKRKSNRLEAKAAGIPSSQLDHLLKSFRSEDKQAPVDKLKRDMQNLAFLGLIPDPSVKGDLFSQPDRVDNEGMIQAKGFFAGLNSLDRVSGFDGGSSDDKLWLSSYDAGKAEFEVELPKVFEWLDAQNNKEAPPADGDDSFEAASETIN